MRPISEILKRFQNRLIHPNSQADVPRSLVESDTFHPKPDRNYELFGVADPKDIPHECSGCSRSYSGLLQPGCEYCGAGRAGYYREVTITGPNNGQTSDQVSSEQLSLSSFYFPDFGADNISIGEGSTRDKVRGGVIQITGTDSKPTKINLVGATTRFQSSQRFSGGLVIAPEISILSDCNVKGIVTSYLGSGRKSTYGEVLIVPSGKFWLSSGNHIQTLLIGPTQERLYIHNDSVIDLVLATPNSGEIACGSNCQIKNEQRISYEFYYKRFYDLVLSARNVLYK